MPKAKQDAKQRVLFVLPKPPGQNRGHVALNCSGDPLRDLDYVAESYQSLARDRLQFLHSNRPNGLHTDDAFEAYPIVFLYRQAFELSLKAVIFAGAALLRDKGEEPMPLETLMKHELMPFLKETLRIFKRFGWRDAWDLGEPGLRTRADLEKVVREFDYIDAGSYTFRYTMKTDGTTPSLDIGFEFDLCTFAEIMEKMLARLKDVPEMIREEMQGRWEAAYEAQLEAWANADYEPPDYDSDPPDYEPPDYEP